MERLRRDATQGVDLSQVAYSELASELARRNSARRRSRSGRGATQAYCATCGMLHPSIRKAKACKHVEIANDDSEQLITKEL